MSKLIAKRFLNNFATQPFEKIDTPLNGTMNCSGLVTDASCSFSCDPGYDLVGSRFRTCLSPSKWGGNLTFCKGNYYHLFIELSWYISRRIGKILKYAVSGYLARILSLFCSEHWLHCQTFLRISEEVRLLTLVKSWYLSTFFRSLLKSQLILPSKLLRRDSEKMLP